MEFTIGEAAAELGVTAHAIRYYERLGLVTIPRNSQGHRLVDEPAMRRLAFLVRMRSAGIGMSDLQHYVSLIADGQASVPARLALMETHRDAIRERIAELQLALEATERKIAAYGGTLSDDPQEKS